MERFRCGAAYPLRVQQDRGADSGLADGYLAPRSGQYIILGCEK